MLNQNFWRKYFKAYDVLNKAIPYQELMTDIIASLEIKEGDYIFDAGSGTGNLSLLMKRNGARVKSMDYSEAGVNIHKEKDREVDVLIGNLMEKLPFEANVFDKIVTNNVLYTLDVNKRLAVVKEFYRILKKGGRIVCANVNVTFKPILIFKDHLRRAKKRDGIFMVFVELISFAPTIIKMLYYNYLITKEGHGGSYSFFKENEQKDLLIQAGFEASHKTKLSYSNQSYIDIGIK